MDDGADASREYERLRAELAEFVLDALAERIAAGDEPRLGKALAEAIDKRVDAAVQDRLARAKWPDPRDFADAVIDAAGGRPGGGDRLAAAAGRSRPAEASPRGRSAPARKPAAVLGNFTPLHMALIALIVIVIVAGGAYLFLRGSGAAPPAVQKADPPIEFIEKNPVPPGDNIVTDTSGGGVAETAREDR